MRRSIAVLALVLCHGLLVGSGGAVAAEAVSEDVARTLDAVREDLVELRFESALAALEKLLAEPGLNETERADALVVQAQTRVAAGDLSGAEADYREILLLRPGFVPDANLTPQKAMKRFDSIQRKMVGRLKLDADPPDVRLSVDGREVSPDAQGVVAVAAGEHSVLIEAPGFDPEQRTVDVEAGKEVPVNVALIPNARTVILETEPDGVEVWVDGERVGETRRPTGSSHLPATLELANLPLGDHRFELRKACHRTERLEEFLTIDLLDRSPRRVGPVRMKRARATIVLEGGPAGAEVRVDDSPVGRLPVDPYSVCPGRRSIEVRFGGRVLWYTEVEFAESTEVEFDVTPRPNVVLFGAEEWPAGLSDFSTAFNTLDARRLRDRRGLDDAGEWARVDLPAGTDLAIAVVPARREGARDGWFVYSPILRVAATMEAAPAVAERPVWETTVWGVRTVDSRWGGNGLVLGLPRSGAPEGLEIGDRIVGVNGRPVANGSELRSRLQAVASATRVSVEWTKPSGERGEGELRGRTSPRLRTTRGDAALDAVLAGWAAVDAASTGDRVPTALANLALLLSEYGHHGLAAETWQRVRWNRKLGISDGTRAYYLGREFHRLGKEEEAVAQYLEAADSDATTFDDDGPRIAPAATDRLADLGVRPD